MSASKPSIYSLSNRSEVSFSSGLVGIGDEFVDSGLTRPGQRVDFGSKGGWLTEAPLPTEGQLAYLDMSVAGPGVGPGNLRPLDNRALLNAAERRMNPDYYRSSPELFRAGVNGLASTVTNLFLSSDNPAHMTKDELTAWRIANPNNSFGDGRPTVQFDVDIFNGTAKREVVTGHPLAEDVKDIFSLGLKSLGKSVGTFFGGLGVANDDGLPESLRLQGANDAGRNLLSLPAAVATVVAPFAKFGAKFQSDALLIGHYKKHGYEFRVTSTQEYLDVGRDIMQNGQKVTYFYEPANEVRTGYVSFLKNKSKTGEALFGFVGTNRDGFITTIHTKPRTDLFKLLGDAEQSKFKAFTTDTVGPVPAQGWKYPYINSGVAK